MMTAVPVLMPRRDIVGAIDRLDLSADAKLLLARLADVSMTVGSKVVAIGRQILTFVFEMVRSHPQTTFGLLIGTVLTLLIGSIALVGGLLAPIVGPLLIALGIGVGAVADIQSSVLRQRIALFEAQIKASTDG